jgi:outer membrane murein-binding lipoprotein Lpp
MGTTRPVNSTLRAMVLVGLLLTMTGCDYWPPALQAQVEQLRSETQTLTMEKTQLQNQVNDLMKVKQDLSTQLDDLGRMNREKTGMINSLQNQLDALRAKTVKAVAPKTQAKTPAKTTVKPAVKQSVKKKPAKKM